MGGEDGAGDAVGLGAVLGSSGRFCNGGVELLLAECEVRWCSKGGGFSVS